MIEIKAMSTAINKRMMAGLDATAIGQKLDDAFQEVAELFRGTGWPKPAVFVSAMEAINRKVMISGDAPKSDWSLDPVAIVAKRMNAGDAVGDDWLYGRKCVELMASGQVSQDTLRKYRSALYFSAKAVLNEDKAKELEAGWIKKHEDAEALHRAATGGKRFVAPTYTPKSFPKSTLDSDGNQIAAE